MLEEAATETPKKLLTKAMAGDEGFLVTRFAGMRMAHKHIQQGEATIELKKRRRFCGLAQVCGGDEMRDDQPRLFSERTPVPCNLAQPHLPACPQTIFV